MRPWLFALIQNSSGTTALASVTLDATRAALEVARATETISGKRKLNCTQTSAGLTLNSAHSVLNFPRHSNISGSASGVTLR